MLHYKRLKQIRKIKKLLDGIAYGSLFLDIAVAIDNFISVRQKLPSRGSSLNFWLTLGLSIEVAVTIVLILVLLLLYHYDTIEWLLLNSWKRKQI